MALRGPESYWLVRFLFHRGFAIIYLLAFLVTSKQFRALVGEDGRLLIEEFVEPVALEDLRIHQRLRRR